MDLDKWQSDVLTAQGHVCINSGRQTGKSTVVSIKASNAAITKPDQTILIIAATERQAQLLFDKTLNYLLENYKRYVKGGKDKPTKHQIKLTNNSIIYCLPCGLDGYGIRGYTVDLLIADEAHFIPEAVWTAVTPMLATTGGSMILLSTPHGNTGFFREAFNNPNFQKFHVSSEDCSRISKEFLEEEKRRMTKLQYAQEYLGEFLDSLQQFFPDDLIKKCMTVKREKDISPNKNYFCGVDIARLGNDESTFEIVNRYRDRYGYKLNQVENIITIKTLTTETTQNILNLDKLYNFQRIYVDDGGLGVGVFDQLLKDDTTKRKVEAINNSRRSLDREDKQHKRLMKEDLYNNLKCLMERNEIQLLDDPEIFQSLKSIQYEYNEKQQLKIFGTYTHITEGLIRAAWCVKDRKNDLWVKTNKI